MGVIQGIFGLVTDLYIFILPLPMLWRLQMPLKRKLGITAIFLTGLGHVSRSSLMTNVLTPAYRAILSSSLGLYYRVRETWESDLNWFLAPACGLA